jgi:2-amino-4-hydroxy-6-hydroxymethyldihydropteridine diphosphokinase
MRLVVACSSNMPDRFALVSSASEAVAQLNGLHAVVSSRMVDSADAAPHEPGTLSVLLLVETELAIASLDAEFRGIEAEHGRVRGERPGERPVELELVWAEDVRLTVPGVLLPNPRLVSYSHWQRSLAELIGMAAATDAIAAAHSHAGLERPRDAARTEYRWSGGWDAVKLRGDV